MGLWYTLIKCVWGSEGGFRTLGVVYRVNHQRVYYHPPPMTLRDVMFQKDVPLDNTLNEITYVSTGNTSTMVVPSGHK